MTQRFPRSTPNLERSPLVWLLVAAGLACAPFACSASPPPSAGGEGGSGGSDSSSHGGSGHGGEAGTNLTVGSGGTGGPSCAVHCSADLHQVLDCYGNVIQTCPADQGCGPSGTCIAPCESAQANESTLGCDFYSVVPAPENSTQGSCYAVLLANTWTTPVTLQAQYGGQTLDIGGLARTPVGSGQGLTYQPLPNGQLAPGQVAVLFLAQAPSAGNNLIPCPAGVSVGVNSNVSLSTTGLTKAFRVTTSAPVVAYDIYPYGGAQSYVSSATLLVPTPAWGTNYIAADGYEQDPLLASAGGSPFVQIVASQDDTKVTISPTVPIVGGPGVAATGQGQPTTYTLNNGQVLQLLQAQELAGSPISADKPISVWGGSGCMNIPIGKYACDSGHQQLLPVKALGSEYVAVRYRDRAPGANESVPWTLIGAVDDTSLTYDPAPPQGAPTSLASGQMVRFSADSPFSVKSQDDQHPFYVAGHMTGWTNLSGSNAGDSEYVIVLPPRQYLSRYLFLTDPTYGNTNLVFVRQKGEDGTFKPVKLDCAGELGNWQPLGVSGQYEFTRVDLVANGAPVGACDNGVHTAESEVPFGLTVWGWDFAVSYAYPAGMSTQPINTVVVPPVPK
ncbi:IgGFc-binding protein [Polyangium aurulentum]|uniref:IgGFc-binding protein n=1 Tax=Polyangium aurulentum TaxID=2567896 RepID=UPI0010AEB370|nr:IgGFc-binding protein [Polyangium aurulentum]UQA60668.1 IgGFc-binding protein [Polyangium aurulentum]